MDMMGRIIGVALALVLALVLLAPFSARSESLIVEDKATGEFVVLRSDKCTDASVTKIIPPQSLPEFSSGEAFVSKKMWPICWTLLPDMSVLFVFPDGDIGRVPMNAFRKMSTV